MTPYHKVQTFLCLAWYGKISEVCQVSEVMSARGNTADVKNALTEAEKNWKVIVLMWIWRPHPRQACAQLLWKMIHAELSGIEARWVVPKLSNGKVTRVAFLAFDWVKKMCAYGSQSRAPMQTNNRQWKKKQTGNISAILVWRQLRSDSPILAKISTGPAILALYNTTMDTQWVFCRQGVATTITSRRTWLQPQLHSWMTPCQQIIFSPFTFIKPEDGHVD